jgi:Uma2 family endonuclease
MKTLAQWTVTDYHRLVETGVFRDRQVELLAGEIIEMAPEGPTHAYLTEGMVAYLRRLLREVAFVREAHPITLSDSEPEPDIAIVQLPRQQYRKRHPYPEDIFWLVEISQSTLDYDLNEKKQAYARAGIPEYWVVEVASKQVHRFLNPFEEDYQSQFLIEKGKITPQAFPKIEVNIDQLWEF